MAVVRSDAFAENKRFQWSTRISVSEEYDDNINLEPDNEEDDWITSVTPGLTLTVETEKTDINLDYDLSLVSYADNTENNTVRHSLLLSGFEGIPISEHVTLDLEESLQVSEDPVEMSDYVTSERRTRNRYYRNTAGGRINWLFGQEDSLYAGFHHIFLVNDESDVEDSQSYRPIAGINYWFNIHHGCSFDYSYVRGEFDLSDDYDEHMASTAYIYRFSPASQASLSYTYDALDYDGTREDYTVHSGSLQLSHQFTEQASGSISGGYYNTDRERSDNVDGFTGTISFSQRFDKGQISVNGSTGYRQQFYEAENLGFSEYYRTSAAFDYQLFERLSATVSGFYNREDYLETVDDREDKTWGGRASINCVLFRWLSASLSYNYRQMDSNINANDYTDNRVTMTLRASYSGKPRPF
jgi:hypothetical protein